MTGSGTYALLAVPFLGAAVLVAVLAGVVSARRRRGDRPGARAGARGPRSAVLAGVVAGVALLVMTGVFNNVIVGLGIVAIPALSLNLALPNAGVLPKGSEARVSYDLTADEFGPGFNGPLILTGTIVTSADPLKLMQDLGDEVAVHLTERLT